MSGKLREMTHGIWEEKTGFHQFFWLAMMMVGGLGIAASLGVPIAKSVFNLHLNFEAWFDAEEYKYVQGIRWVQALVSLMTFLIPALLLRHFAALKENAFPVSSGFKIGAFLFMISSLFWIGLLSEWMQSLPWPGAWGQALLDEQAKQDALVDKFLSLNSPLDLLLNIIVLALLPAVGEEFLFRGTLMPILWKKNKPWVVILLSGLIFALVHQQAIHFPGILILGVFLAWVYFHTRDLLLVIGLHFLNNAWLILWMYFSNLDAFPWTLSLAGFIVSLASFGFMAKISGRKVS